MTNNEKNSMFDFHTYAFITYSFFAYDKPISVTLDGEKFTFDVEPALIDGHTMVPIRAIFEAMGAVVEWDNDI